MKPRDLPSLTELGRYGARLAVIDEAGKAWRYAELVAAADAFAGALGERRQLLLLEARNDIRSLIALLGALENRHPVIIAPPGEASESIAAIYRPEVIVRADREGGPEQAIVRQQADAVELHPELALMLSTSGSTGSPKLVRLSLASLDANAASIATYLEIGADSRAITSLPLSYSYGLSVVTSHLAAGGSLVLTSASVIDPEFRHLCELHGVTGVAGVPYSYELMERAGFIEDLPRSVGTLTQAGGRMPPERVSAVAEQAEAQGARLFVMYGQTEATARMAYVPPALLRDNPDAVGVAIPGGRFSLLDDDGVPINRSGQAGELVYAGPNVMLGYATERADLAKGREIEALHTGDVAMRGGDGLYRVVGRKSRFVKLFGLRIGLDDIERQFRERGIEAVAAGDDSMLAVVVPDGCDAGAQREWLAQQLKIQPSAIDVTAGPVPRLGNGKVDFGAIRSAAMARLGNAREGGEGERTVEGLLSQLFPRRPIDPQDSFVTLGGDSLSYVQMSMGLEDVLGYIPDDWENLPLAQLEALPRRAGGPRRAWQLRGLETDIVVRAAAILAIVVNHASNGFPVGGGANVLLLLFGLNFFRYSGRQLHDGVSLTPLRNFFLRIVAPYYLLLLAFEAATGKIDVSSLLLVSNFSGRFGNLMEPYWFIEVVAQILLLLTLAFAAAPVRRIATARPWPFALAFVGLACAASLAALLLAPRPELSNRTPEFLLWLTAAGWALAQAKSAGRKLALFALVGLMTIATIALLAGQARGYLQTPTQIGWIIAATALLLWVPRIALPGFLRSAISLIAGASLQIYLVHNIVTHEFLYVFHVANLPVILTTSVAAGLAFRWVQDAVGRRLAASTRAGGRTAAPRAPEA